MTEQNPNLTPSAAEKEALARNPASQRAAHEPTTVGANKQEARSTLITNPAPGVEAPPERKIEETSVPQSTLDEMAAGKKALERNKPVAQALEQARDENAKSKA